MKVYEVIARVLAREGVEAVFAVMGDANMRWLVELRRFPQVRVYYARHENSAVAMADGYARATGKIGLCTVTCGPGLALTADSLVTARNHGTPLLLIAGDTPTGMLQHIQELDQGRFADALSVQSYDMMKADSAAEDLALALSVAATRGAPVVLNVPTDLQEADYRWEVDETPMHERMPAAQRAVPDIASLGPAIELLAAAERPIVIAGRGAADARAEIDRVADMLGALVSTTLLAKGLFAGDPFDLGVAGLFSHDRAQALFAEADVVLAVGAGLNHYTTESGVLFPNASLVHVDIRRFVARPGARPPDRYLQGDARATLAAIADALEADRRPRTGLRTPEMAASLEEMRRQALAIGSGQVSGGLDPRAVMSIVDAEVGEQALFVIGMGHFWWFAINYLRGGPQRSFILTHDFGSIGQALPTAIGAAIGLPGTRVFAVEGDASILMCVQEMDTAARYGVPVWAVVMNDGGVGAEFHHLRAVGMDPGDAILRSPDLALVARAFGAVGTEVRSLGELRAALADRTPGPHLLDARIARDVIAEPYRKLWYPEATTDTPS
jgi:thiamine pyrophosphate-dependent acetolactate synthase large subunit-like protein